MSLPTIYTEVLILCSKADVKYLDSINYSTHYINAIISTKNPDSFDFSQFDFVVVYKPKSLKSVDNLSLNFQNNEICFMVDVKQRVEALELLNNGLFDFREVENDNVDQFLFQLCKWSRATKKNIDSIRNKENCQELNELLDQLKLQSEQQKEELSAVIDDLESFSYSVSHDLRAPLRAISGFSDLLQDEYTDKLDDEGKRYLKIITDGTKQMSSLIDDLLSFSRVGRKEFRGLLFDPTTIVKDIVDSTKILYKKPFEIEIANLDVIFGDAGSIKHLFSNLIRNAFKFSFKEENPVIKIQSKKKEGGVMFSIIDNGIGFDMRYKDKLFKVFQRLHTSNEFEGTGIGLAIVSRIVNKHGGEVWAESWENGGAGFYFWLPNQNNNN